MTRRTLMAVTLLAASLPAGAAATESVHRLPLAGEWGFAFDREDRGATERWFERTLGGHATLPGSLPAQGKGDPVTVKTAWTGSIFDRSYYTAERYAPYRETGHEKVPFWLQPDTYYAGVAWYQRDVVIPEEWAGRRVELVFERPHWQTQVWLDERELGTNDSLSTPHVYDLGAKVGSGRHRLSVRVDNGRVVDIGENSHSISDHTQGNWNGIVGAIELRATAPVWIDELQVYPDVAAKSARFVGRVQAVDGSALPEAIEVEIDDVRTREQAGKRRAVRVSADGSFAGELALGTGALLWDEFQPALHRLTATLANGEARSVTFGLREILADGAQLRLNGRKLFIRATLECAIFPKTGHPPVDVGSWKRLLEVARAHGLNSLRFHSWCPPEAAFVAGDELGFYFQIEAASWPNQSTTLGDGKPVDAWLERETLRILRAYGNHPSFVFMSSSNEPGGEHGRDAWLASWVSRHRAADPRRLFTSGSGWPQLAENQFHVTPDPRIQHWEEGLKSRINARPPETCTDYRDYIAAHRVPVISHEIGQWCVFPDFGEIPAYTGYLKPRNFEIFRETLAQHGLADQARTFLQASGKLQALCYKEDIESALRTPGMGGFQLLDLHDFPGQGTALVGVLNPFWESKGYITAADYRRFCGATVPLARLARRVFTTDDTLEVECEIAHFGAAPLAAAASSWQLRADDGTVVAKGTFPVRDIPVGNGTALGAVHCELRNIPAPARYRLVVGIDGTAFENDWDLWVYPVAVDTHAGDVVVTHAFDACTEEALRSGRAVLLAIPPGRVRNDGPDPVALGFSSIFWNTSWTNRQAPTTLGIFCDPRHPALAEFPTDGYSNWQWWYLVSQAATLRLGGLPASLPPIVGVIDDWFTSRRLALVTEARVGRGRLLVTSIDLDAAGKPVGRQLKASLLHYMRSDAFRPATTLSLDQVRGWFAPASAPAASP